MASTLADDLLKTRSIHDLRDLVRSLQVDADGKKAELQSMVGSQYQEFIQSADRIAKMQTQSRDVLDMLKLLEDHTQESIKNVGYLIGNKPTTLDMSTTSRGKVGNLEDITSSAVWKDLNKLDIFSAMKKSMISQIVLGIHTVLPSSQSSRTAIFQSYLMPDSLSQIKNLKIGTALKRDMKSVFFLTETIAHDAKLFCLADARRGTEARTLQSKAKALAAYRLLTCSSSSDALHIFTQSIDMELKEMIKRELGPSSSPESHEAGLEALVKKLQHAVMDLFILFCRPFYLSQTATPGSASGPVVHGLVHFYMLQAIVDINDRFHPDSPIDFHAPPDSLLHCIEAPTYHVRDVVKEIKDYLNKVFAFITDQCQLVLQSITNALQVATLQHLIYHACTNLHYHSNAEECQQVLSLGYWSIPYNQSLYMEASYELLSNKIIKHKRSISGSINHTLYSNMVYNEANALLWNKVFYVLFLNIVENLLCKACEDIWTQSIQLLVMIFKSMGVSIHLHMTSSGGRGQGKIVVERVECNAAGPGLSSAQIYNKADYLCSFFDHAVAKLLEDVIKPVHRSGADLAAEDADSPNTLSLTSLNKALRLYCSKLCGQFLCTIRTLTQHLQAVLYAMQAKNGGGEQASVTLRTGSKGVAGGGTQYNEWLRLCDRPGLEAQVHAYDMHFQSQKAQQESQSVDTLLGGLLLMGRIAWTMRFRSSALYAALQDSPAPPVHPSTPHSTASASANTAAPSVAAAAVNSVTLEQFKSAFEIADTNGDGILERDEAMEALQALSISEDASTATASSAGSLLNQISSLTFSEFLLVFGTDCLTADASVANGPASCNDALLQELRGSLDYIAALSHTLFVLCVSQYPAHTSSLHSALIAELGVDASTANAMVHKFKATWVSQSLEDVDGGVDKVSIPSQSSSALICRVFQLMQVVNHRMVSIDALQIYPLDTTGLNQSEVDEDLNGMQRLVRRFFAKRSTAILTDLVSRQLQTLWLEAIGTQYRQVSQEILQAMQLRGGALNAQGTSWGDEALLQLVVDLRLCENLCERVGTSTEEFARLRTSAMNAVDPILAELIFVPLQTAIANILQRVHLLVAPYSATCALSITQRTTLTANAPATNIIPNVFASGGSTSVSSLRFALLPLALITSTPSAKLSSNHGDRDRDRRDGVTSRSTNSSPLPSSSSTSNVAGSASGRGGGIMGWFSSK